MCMYLFCLSPTSVLANVRSWARAPGLVSLTFSQTCHCCRVDFGGVPPDLQQEQTQHVRFVQQLSFVCLL